jgi:hypothetical protein
VVGFGMFSGVSCFRVKCVAVCLGYCGRHELLISPSVGGVGLVEYVCAHPCLTNCFSEEGPDFVPEDAE